MICLPPPVRRIPQRNQIRAATDAIYLLQGEDDVEKSGLAHEFEELVEERARAFNVERMPAGDVTTAASKLWSAGVGVARRPSSRTLPDDVAAPRRSSSTQADSRSRPPSARATPRRGRSTSSELRCLKQPDPQTTLVLRGAGTLDRAQPYVSSCWRSERRIVECGVIADQARRGRWIQKNRVRGGRLSDPARRPRALARRARRHRRQAPAQRRRAAAVVRPGTEDDYRWTMRGRSSGRRRSRTTGR